MPTTCCMMGIVWVGGAPGQSACGATGDTSTERIPAQRSHSWHYCILAGSQGDAPRRSCEQKSGRGHSGRTQSRRKTRKMVFRKKSWQRHFSAADTTGRNSAISCRIYPSNTPLRLTLSILVTVWHTERDFLPKAAQTKTLPDPQRDALNMPTTTG